MKCFAAFSIEKGKCCSAIEGLCEGRCCRGEVGQAADRIVLARLHAATLILQVSQCFESLKDTRWVTINADQPIDDIHKQVRL